MAGLALMLREWTCAGYTTRDYANFPVPYVSMGRTPEATLANPEPTVTPPSASASARISINRATEAELAAVKGLSKPVAKAIVAIKNNGK